MIMKNFFIEEDGATAIEYAIIAGGIGAVVLAAVTTLGGQIDVSFGKVVTALGGSSAT